MGHRIVAELKLAGFWLLSVLVIAASGCESRLPEDGRNGRLPVSVGEQPPAQPAATAGTSRPVPQASQTPSVKSSVRLRDCAAEVGLDFRYVNGPLPLKMMVQSTGGGGGWLDYDRDGALDVYLTQGGDPTLEIPDPVGDRLFRGCGGRFCDTSSSLFLDDRGYGQGVTAGDFDNDGFPDVFVTNVGPDFLLRNLGDGTFEDITSAAGVGDPRWGTGAAWGDLDEDGDLDLYVCNYLKYDVRDPVPCFSTEGKKGICHPEQLPPDDNECFENLGDGSFRPVAAAWGMGGPAGKSLGVVIADLAGDRRLDVFVANDTMANHLFVRGDGMRFEERAVELGCALTGGGRTQANMGVAFGDYNRDGYPDLYVTHFTSESNTLYANLGPPGFRDVTIEEGLHRPTLDDLGFGTVMADLNADGRDELFVANGHIDDWRYRGEAWYMPSQLFEYDGRRRWTEVTSQAGPYFEKPFLGRAVASGDFDDDGRVDLLVVNQNDGVSLLRNESPQHGRLQVDLQGAHGPRDAIGARVEVRCGKTVLVQQLAGGTSYCATHQPRLFFGLGDEVGPCHVSITWPGTTSPRTFTAGENRRIIVREGMDAPVSSVSL